MSTVYKRFVTLVVGIILLIIALFLNRFNLVRVILSLASIVFLTYSSQIERNNKILFIPLFAIIFTFLVIALDYLCVSTLKHIPIFTYNITSTESGKVYNAIGYRVWSCQNKTFKVDPLYKLGYYCEKENLTSENINNVLSNIENDFNRYSDNYVKVIGRVSKVIDDKTILMQSYDEYEDMIRFNETINLYVSFNIGSKEISNLEQNTLVTIIGKIDRKDNNNIYMIDSKISMSSVSTDDINIDADSNIYCEYDKELWFQTTDNIFYKSCINDINIKINGNLYNLYNALKNNLITFDEIKNEALGYQEQSSDESVIYNYEGFKIMVCDPRRSKDIIVGKSTMDFSDGYCDVSIDSDKRGN